MIQTAEQPFAGIGRRLTEARDRRGLSRREVQDRTEIPQSTLQEYESGKTELPMSRAVSLGKLYGEDPFSFFTSFLVEQQVPTLAPKIRDGAIRAAEWLQELLMEVTAGATTGGVAPAVESALEPRPPDATDGSGPDLEGAAGAVDEVLEQREQSTLKTNAQKRGKPA